MELIYLLIGTSSNINNDKINNLILLINFIYIQGYPQSMRFQQRHKTI